MGIEQSGSGIESSEKLSSKEKIWDREIDFSGDAELRSRLEEMVRNSENYLGEGGAGMVFNIGDQCIKLVLNRHKSEYASRFDLGNSPEDEVKIQSVLNDLVVDGVFAPRVAAYYVGEKTAAIVMERLDAVDMQLVINRKKELPKSFDVDDFFFVLENYIDEMHQAGIIHGDLNPKNIMIDRKTGLPRLIDFGRSKHFKNKPENFEFLANKEFKDLEKCYDEMKEFLDKSK